jgi:hypothetical protein
VLLRNRKSHNIRDSGGGSSIWRDSQSKCVLTKSCNSGQPCGNHLRASMINMSVALSLPFWRAATGYSSAERSVGRTLR